MSSAPPRYVDRAEAERALQRLTDEQLDDLERACTVNIWACGRYKIQLYKDAVARGWLLGPA